MPSSPLHHFRRSTTKTNAPKLESPPLDNISTSLFHPLRKVKARLFSSKLPKPWADQTSTCRILALPAELRNEIFALALTRNSPLELRTLAQPALTRTCRQLQAEALPIYFTVNSFRYSVFCEPGCLVIDRLSHSTKSFTDRIRHQSIPIHIRHVTFHIFHLPGDSGPFAEIAAIGKSPMVQVLGDAIGQLTLGERVLVWIEKVNKKGKGFGVKEAETFVAVCTRAPLKMVLRAFWEDGFAGLNVRFSKRGR